MVSYDGYDVTKAVGSANIRPLKKAAAASSSKTQQAATSSAESSTKKTAEAKEQRHASFAPIPPPPAIPSRGDAASDEDLTNLLMAWYYSGYYTGLYQVRTDRVVYFKLTG